MSTETSDGSTASYYELPAGATELQDLISHRNMNAQIGEIFRAAYRYGMASHSDMLRDAKKIKFYAEAEIKRLQGSLERPEAPKVYTPKTCPHGKLVGMECIYCQWSLREK